MSEIILGIDLGISISKASIYRDGKLDMVPSYDGESVCGKYFPSYVAFTKDGDLLVGEPARKQATKNPENTITEIKRHIGDKNYKINIQGKQYAPQQISAFILKKIKNDAEKFIGEEIRDAVIAVPSYFDNNQRTATIGAGRIAGLNVKLINEPTAACIAYGIDKQGFDNLNILIFNMDGGTVDVTIMELYYGNFNVQAVSGDTKLGGTDIQNTLMYYIVAEFEKEYDINLFDNPINRKLLIQSTKEAIIKLNTNFETDVNLNFISMKTDNRINFHTTITQSKQEELISPILEKCGDIIQKALDDAIMTVEDVDKVILVGGPTRMPIVRKFIEDYMGMSAENESDPIYCVCQGAAVYGVMLCNNNCEIMRKNCIYDVLPLSIGTEAQDGSASVIFKRLTPIPITKRENYTTVYDNQTSISINLVLGERTMACDNVQLGSFILNGIPPAPRGVPQIEITYEVNSDGILQVSAFQESTGFKQSIRIEGAMKLDESEIERLIKEDEYCR